MNLQEHGLANNFYFDDDVLFNFHCSLQAKPFTILYGPSGTGKSKIAEVYADYICDQQDLELNEHFCFVPVRPNWTSPTDLMGFYDYLNDHFVPSELYNFMVTASTNLDKPYFLVLDEMNLSVVEHYFSDFLSCLESRRYVKNSGGYGDYDLTPIRDFVAQNQAKITTNIAPAIAKTYLTLVEQGLITPDDSEFDFTLIREHAIVQEYKANRKIEVESDLDAMSDAEKKDFEVKWKAAFRSDFNQKHSSGEPKRQSGRFFEEVREGFYKLRTATFNKTASPTAEVSITQHLLEVYKNQHGVEKIEIPLNLYIIGTINMDESTQPLSGKVLDRANLIEMNIVSRDILGGQSTTSGLCKVDGIDPAFSQITSLATMKGASRLNETHPELIKTIYDVNDGLIKPRTNMGHRAIFEMCHYVDIYTATLNDPNKATEALDIQFSQKLIPKLMGSDDRVETSILHTVKTLTQGKVNSGEQLRDENMSQYAYPKTLDKLQRMFNYYVHNGFVNFANV